MNQDIFKKSKSYKFDGVVFDIDTLSKDNKNYRDVFFTSPNSFQISLMNINPLEEIGMEVHKNVDQFVRIEKGIALVTISDNEYILTKGYVAQINAGASHNIKNMSNKEPLKLSVIYSKALHKPDSIEKNKMN